MDKEESNKQKAQQEILDEDVKLVQFLPGGQGRGHAQKIIGEPITGNFINLITH